MYPAHLAGQVVAALETGRHIVLIGPPGTGKTTIAHLAAELAVASGGYVPTTATSAWTTADTVGETVHTREGAVFHPGAFVRALDEGRWLVIDEMNRTDIDAVFGPLITVLSGQPAVLPHRRNSLGRPLSIVPPGAEVPDGTEPIHVPERWRIVATMNDFDRDSLHGLSYALMRRFAFIEVLAPSDEDFAALVGRRCEIVVPLLDLRPLRDLGPALYLDAAEFAARRSQDGCSDSRVRYEAIFAYLLPQMDGIGTDGIARLRALAAPMLEAAERDSLDQAIERALGIPVER